MESPEIDPLNVDKGADAVQWRKNSPSANSTGATGCKYTRKRTFTYASYVIQKLTQVDKTVKYKM